VTPGYGKPFLGYGEIKDDRLDKFRVVREENTASDQNMVVSPVGLRNKNLCPGEDQQQFNSHSR
jgi:hypothetical protein